MFMRENLIASIASIISDYRATDLGALTTEHIERWVLQFDDAVQLPILNEMDHILKSTYFSLEKVTSFLELVIQSEKLAGNDQTAFWGSVHFLNIQGGGNSQKEMLELFSAILQEKCGFSIEESSEDSSIYLYLDDAVFTGNRVLSDIKIWITEQAPQEATLHIVTIALHRGGQYYANKRITETVKATGKKIYINWWRAIELEDRKTYIDDSDVLRPMEIPDDPDVHAYIESMTHKPILRAVDSLGHHALFSSMEGRNILEQEFLKAGVKIRNKCPLLGDTQRPLGHMTLEMLGCGSLIVTFRNCPNNAPLALWVGDPWYPLFPRTTNSATAINRLLKGIF